MIIKEYVNDMWDFGMLGITFTFTLFITQINEMLSIHITPQLLSDFITLITQVVILGVVLYKFKLLRENNKNKKNGDSRR
jgi:hypothetical protein